MKPLGGLRQDTGTCTPGAHLRGTSSRSTASFGELCPWTCHKHTMNRAFQ